MMHQVTKFDEMEKLIPWCLRESRGGCIISKGNMNITHYFVTPVEVHGVVE